MQNQSVKYTCVSCTTSYEGKYCNHCGEKRLEPHERTILYFLKQLFNAITSIDNKLLRSFWYLVRKPGFLTREYIDGKRKLYTTPLSLFFMGNVLYFLISPMDALNSHFNAQTGGQVYRNISAKMAGHKMEAKQWDAETIRRKYDDASTNISKSILILFPILFSIPVSLMFMSKRQYYFNHLMFAIEFTNYIIYYMLVLMPFIMAGLYLLFRMFFKIHYPDVNSDPALIATGILLLVPLIFSTRRVYNQNWFYTIIKSVLLTLSIAFVIIAYRFVLFLVTLWIL